MKEIAPKNSLIINCESIYEDSTKIYPTKQTLNYNLNKYLYLDSATDLVKNIAMMRTRFDLTDPSTETILNQFSNRITNFSGSYGFAIILRS